MLIRKLHSQFISSLNTANSIPNIDVTSFVGVTEVIGADIVWEWMVSLIAAGTPRQSRVPLVHCEGPLQPPSRRIIGGLIF